MIEHSDIKYFKLAIGADSIGRISSTDISARCPICGDSAKNTKSKRLHLYNKNNKTRINCFNGDCNVNNKTMYGFLKDFFPKLFAQYKRDNFTNTIQKLGAGAVGTSNSSDVFARFALDEKAVEKEPKVSPVVTQDLSAFLRDVSEVPEVLAYLAARGMEYTTKYGKWYFGYQDLQIGDMLYKITDSIIIPLYYKDKMYGFYSRSIKDKMFITYMNDTNIGYKIWNWFNINKKEPVYIYEGIFDAIAGGLQNSIALLGAKIPTERLQELDNPIFVLDNDKTGLINALQYVKSGNKVYVQPEIYSEKDMNELMLNLMLNNTDVNISDIIKNNIYSGILGQIKIKAKL